MKITKRDGSKQNLDLNKIHNVLTWACEGANDDALHPIKGVSISQIEMIAHLRFYDGMPTKEIHETLIKAASELISEDFPNYDQVAARLVWFSVRKEAFRDNLPLHLYEVVTKNIKKGIYTPELLEMYTKEEFDELNSMIDHKRDDLFKYAGAEQMRKKYLAQNRKTKQIYESFQFPYILVSAILFSKYDKNIRMQFVKKYYDLISQHYISLPTPIMAGLRTKVKQFSSCVLIEAGDSLKSINAASAAIVDYASRKAGIGLSIGSIRAEGQPVRNGDAVTTGVLPFAKYFNAALKSCSQGAVRGASATLNYPIWHLEFERLIELKNNKGTEETRLRTVDYCVHLNKLFYERLIKKEKITFFSPEEVKDLYQAFYSDNYEEFERLYHLYEKDNKKTKKTLPAIEVFTKILQERFETGRIYIMNADHVNKHGSFYEPIKMTNLCLTGDTKIVTNKGIKTLEELFVSQEDFFVSSDNRAIDNEQELEYKVVNQNEELVNNSFLYGTNKYKSSKVFLTNPNAEIFEVKTINGYSIKGTSNHKVMTTKGWKEIGLLNETDEILLQSGVGMFAEEYLFNKSQIYDNFIQPTKATEELGEFLGYFMNNGYINLNDEISISFNAKQKFFLNKFIKYLNKLTNNCEYSIKEEKDYYIVSLKNNNLSNWLREINITSETELPKFIWSSDKETISGFIKGFMIESDILYTNKTFCLNLHNKRKKLLEEISILLSNFGINCSIHLIKNKTFNLIDYLYSLQIVDQNYLNEIGIFEEQSNEKVIDLMIYKEYKNNLLKSNHLNGYKDSIALIKKIGYAPVYDITVNESHSFIANGIVVHNCTEITLPTTPITYEGDSQYNHEESLIALCTLSAINYGKFTPYNMLDINSVNGQKQVAKLKETCEMAVRGLDALLDYQEYPVAAAKKHSMKYRPLGIGIIGFAHWLAKGRLYWGEDNTLEETETMMEQMAYFLTEASINLAKEFGPIKTRTKYHDGIFPIDTSSVKAKTKMDWNILREEVKKYGIRNATLMALMPSETSSQLANETNGFEPPRDMVSIKGSKEGVLPQVVPEYTKYAAYYETLWQVQVKKYLKTTAIFLKYLDQAASVNTSYNPSNGEIKMSDLIEDLILAYLLGHKTLYYNNTKDGSGEEVDDNCASGACKI